ncbi:hypothetical protein [Klebsiella quasipneumoniae]|uniref:hypothetical protein n=1 Tax=Klebsiella quasipneumoniae TaxID=1463165 RepID=UPI002731F9E5|nr:hypothetical protein [Klebsiella quasipneumoniae]MDP1051714.1 hypothetical protein [Klebsiella quasipneumoniae]
MTMVTGAATDAIKVLIREGLTVVFLFGYLLWMNWKLMRVLLSNGKRERMPVARPL